MATTTTTSMTTIRSGAMDHDVSSSSSSSDRLRELFPDRSTVLIYPDDFASSSTKTASSSSSSSSSTTTNTTTETMVNIVFPDLINRMQGHFSNRRLALLFRPGIYHNVNCPVGYWTQVLGLGETPQQVQFTGRFGPHAIPANTDDNTVGSLDTFWRCAENFYSDTTFVLNPQHLWSIPVGTVSPEGIFPSLYPVHQCCNTNNEEEPSLDDDASSRGMIWAVSQAAPLRRIQIGGNLHLSLGNNYASGGFVANLDVGGNVLLGSQQQFCIRNCNIGQQIYPAVWSTVLIGNQYQQVDSGCCVPQSNDDDCMVTHEPTARTRIEKPFIFLDDDSQQQVYLAIPKVQFDSIGIQHSKLDVDEKVLIDNDKYAMVITPNDSYDKVQQAASRGLHIILSPGIYHWGKTLQIGHANQVVLGLGMATIQAPTDGSPCIYVAPHVGGVRISGVALEASILQPNKYRGSMLLQWGDDFSKDNSDNNNNNDPPDPGDARNPGAIHDLYCFVGGRIPSRDVQVECMVRLYSGNIVGDNLWLWRADHVASSLTNEPHPNQQPSFVASEYHLTTYGECKCDVALEVFGDNVLFYGLAAEHTYANNVIWHGRNGTVLFYQNELPYDVPGEVVTTNVAGYLVQETAMDHMAKGVGVYSFFRDYHNVQVSQAVRHLPKTSGIYENVFSVWLNGSPAIQSVINGLGDATSEKGRPRIVRHLNLVDEEYSGVQKEMNGSMNEPTSGQI